MRPISVAQFCNTSQRGGAEQHILTLLRGLDRKYFKLLFICTPELFASMRNDIPEDVVVFPLRLNNPLQFSSAWRLARILRRERIDILHSHLFYGSRYASPIGWSCRVPVLIETPHIREHWRRGWKASFAADRCIAKCINYYVAVSQANADYLIQEKRLPADKVVVIQNGCDVERFAHRRKGTPDLRRRLGFGPNDPVLIVPARLEPQKGHCFLLQALPDIFSEFPSTRIVFVGDGGLRKELEAAVGKKGWESSVKFAGYQSNVEDWLSMADLTVLPSLYEGLPLAAMESLAASRPVLASAVDGTPEVVLNGQTGLTVPPGDPPQLAAAVRYLLRNPKVRERFGRCGRDHVLRHFTQQRQIRRTEELYNRSFQKAAGRLQ